MNAGFTYIKRFFFKVQRTGTSLVGRPVVKNPSVSAGDRVLIPGLGRSHMPLSN